MRRPNKATLKAMDDVDNRRDLESADTVENMFEKIGEANNRDLWMSLFFPRGSLLSHACQQRPAALCLSLTIYREFYGKEKYIYVPIFTSHPHSLSSYLVKHSIQSTNRVR